VLALLLDFSGILGGRGERGEPPPFNTGDTFVFRDFVGESEAGSSRVEEEDEGTGGAKTDEGAVESLD